MELITNIEEEELTVGSQSLGAVGEADNVSVSFKDEDFIVTTRHGHNVPTALQGSDHYLKQPKHKNTVSRTENNVHTTF